MKPHLFVAGLAIGCACLTACGPDNGSGIAAPTSAAPTTSSAAGVFSYFANTTYGYTVQTPIGWTVAASADGASETWTSPDGSATVVATGSNSPLTTSPTAALTACVAVAKAAGDTVTTMTSKGLTYTCAGTTSSGAAFFTYGVVGVASNASVTWTFPVAQQASLQPDIDQSVATLTVPGGAGTS